MPGYNDATPLHEAASTGNLGIVAAIVGAGGDPEAESSEPLEPLPESDEDENGGKIENGGKTENGGKSGGKGRKEDEDKDEDTTEVEGAKGGDGEEEEEDVKYLTPIDIAQGNHQVRISN